MGEKCELCSRFARYIFTFPTLMLRLLFTASLLAVLGCFTACNGGAKSETPTAVATDSVATDSVAPAPSEAEAEAVAAPVADLARYNLYGPVKSVTIKNAEGQETIGFDEQGYEAISGRGPVKTRETNRKGRLRTERSRDSGDFWGDNIHCYEDGRLVTVYGVGSIEFEYDGNGRIVKQIIEDEGITERTLYAYDENGHLLKETRYLKESEEDEEYLDCSYTYSILAIDDHGNWTLRKDAEGECETRIITYYK